MLPILAVAAVLALWWLTRTGELFCVSIRDGRALVVRGRVPTLETESGGRLVFSGDIDEGRRQRMRNVFALHPTSQLRQAPAIQQPTVGQLAGVAWLAWLFDRRS